MNIRPIHTIVLSGSLFVASCSVTRPQLQTVPTYIHIDSFSFINNNYAVTGSGSHAISSADVFYNNSPVGNFDLPVTFPVIATGNGTLEVIPGISVNGIEDNQSSYLFYTIDTFNFNASPGNTIFHTPATEYTSAATFPFIADFELGSVPFKLYAGDDSIVITQNPSMVYERKGSGYLYLDIPGDSAVCISSSTNPINGSGFIIQNTNGVAPFCEFNYKSSMPFYVGLIAVNTSLGNTVTSDPYYLAGIYPDSTSWQKFYLQLGNFITSYPATSYILAIKANLPANQKNGYVLFDNIKIVTNQQ